MADRCVSERWTPEAAGGRRPANCRTSRTGWAGLQQACRGARQRAAAAGACPYQSSPPPPAGRLLRSDPAGRLAGRRRPLVGRWAAGLPGAKRSWRQGSSAGRRAGRTFGRRVGLAVEGRRASAEGAAAVAAAGAAAVALRSTVDLVGVLASVPLLFCFSAALL